MRESCARTSTCVTRVAGGENEQQNGKSPINEEKQTYDVLTMRILSRLGLFGDSQTLMKN